MADVVVPDFPDVPQGNGVPEVPKEFGFSSIEGIIPLLSDAIGLALSFLGAWGIFSQFGVPVVIGDSVTGFHYNNDWKVSDYPVQRGGFQTYNKVDTPYDARISFAVSDSDMNRRIFLNLLNIAANSMLLYSIITPEIFYRSATIVRFSYSRTAQNGTKLLIVDVDVREVRLTGNADFVNTKSASGAAPVDGGTVQTGDVATTDIPQGTSTIDRLEFTDPANPAQPPTVYLPPGTAR